MYPVKASDYILKNVDLDSLRLYNDFDKEKVKCYPVRENLM